MPKFKRVICKSGNKGRYYWRIDIADKPDESIFMAEFNVESREECKKQFDAIFDAFNEVAGQPWENEE